MIFEKHGVVNEEVSEGFEAEEFFVVSCERRYYLLIFKILYFFCVIIEKTLGLKLCGFKLIDFAIINSFIFYLGLLLITLKCLLKTSFKFFFVIILYNNGC